MPACARFSRHKIAWLTFVVSLAGCNDVLGINEPEEGPWVKYLDWDGAPWGYDGNSGLDVADASADFGEAAAPGPIDAKQNRPEVREESGASCTNVPTPGAATCGLGCATLCPLGRTCLKDTDCSSGRCFGTRCTAQTCVNGVKDGQESDVDCGGLCATCGPGRACLNNADCTSRVCTNLRCQAPPVDAAVDRRSPSDGSAIDVAPPPDASAIVDADAGAIADAHALLDGDVSVDSKSDDGGAEGGAWADVDSDVDAMDADATPIGCDADCFDGG